MAANFLYKVNDLLPRCQPYPAPRSVIVLDNAYNTLWQLDPRIQLAVEEKGCILKFLPPYSPDYNPIELTFSVLKAWIRRHFNDYWPTFDGNFGEFIQWAVQRSRCDQFAIKHFQYSAGGYIFEGDLEEFETQLQDGVFDVLENIEDEEEEKEEENH